MNTHLVQKIKRLFFMGPIIFISLIALEFITYRVYGYYQIPLQLSRNLQVLLSIVFGAIFIAGYTGFWIAFLKHSVGLKVIKTGIYSVVRHPLYATDIFSLPAFVVIWFNDGMFLFPWLAIVLLAFYYVKFEEKFMEEKYGAEYAQYKSKVPALFPSIRIGRKHE